MRFSWYFALLVSSAAGSFHTVSAEPVPIRIDSHVAVRMRDGVTLYADVYRPRAAGKYPVLVTRTPYGVQRDGMHQNAIRFAENGFAVVVQDVRGRYESEGKWDPFRNEAHDGYDTVQWPAHQPWSDGKVATQGGSYLGHVQWRAATEAPPNLVTAFPMVASTNIYKNWAFLGGAFRLSFNYGWGVVRMPFRIMLPQYWHTADYVPDDWRYEQVLRQLPLGTADLANGHPVQHFRDWVRHQSYDTYWKQISDEERFDQVRVPVHVSGGWFDIFLSGTINGFTGVRRHGATERARRESKIMVGPWGHGASQKSGEIDFGPSAMRSLFEHELRWYNHYLKGENNGIDREPPVEIFFMGVNRWSYAQEWPLPGTKFTSYYLAAGGQLSSTPARGNASESDQYVYDPNNPVPTVGGNNCCGTPRWPVPGISGPLNPAATCSPTPRHP